jgi:CBS domain-containing protein
MERKGEQMTVARIMSRPAICAHPDMSLETVAAKLVNNRLSRLPVVDDQGRLVGIISKTDLLIEELAQADPTEWRPEADRAWRAGAPLAAQGIGLRKSQATLRELMKAAPVTVNETMTITHASKLMAEHHLHGVPVVGANGTVTGMLSVLDIVRWVATEQHGAEEQVQWPPD